jgi:hypothetical protein
MRVMSHSSTRQPICCRCIASLASAVVDQSTPLLVTEAELKSGIECAQDMLDAMRVLDSIGLQVQKPSEAIH